MFRSLKPYEKKLLMLKLCIAKIVWEKKKERHRWRITCIAFLESGERKELELHTSCNETGALREFVKILPARKRMLRKGDFMAKKDKPAKEAKKPKQEKQAPAKE